MRFLSPLLSILLVPVVAGTSLLAQIPAPIPPTGPSSDSGDAPSLQLRVLNPTSAAGDFTVEVTDMAGAPVSNAAVVFRLPDDGSPATFGDGSSASVGYTNASGRAYLSPGVRWVSTAAPITVRITAAKGTAHAGILFEHAPPRTIARTPARACRHECSRQLAAASRPRARPAPRATERSGHIH